MSALSRHAEFFRNMRDRTTREHASNKNQTASRSQPRITVDQEKASTSVTLDTTNVGGLLPTELSPTC